MIIEVCLNSEQWNYILNELGYVSIYTNLDNFQTPVIENIDVTNLVLPNCPMTVEVPDGTTIIKVFDLENFKCVYLPVVDDLCISSCGFKFDIIPNNNGALLECGNLVFADSNTQSSNNCYDGNVYIEGYRIEWINDSNEVVLTTGKGYFSYEFEHPLTGNSQPPLPPGTYTPILTHVQIVNYTGPLDAFPWDGVIYEETENYQGSYPYNGEYAPVYPMPLNECFESHAVTTKSWDCLNGSNFGVYTHGMVLYGQGYGVDLPIVTAQHFEIGEDTKYFAWEFKAYNASDTIKLTLHSQSYSYPIILEWYSLAQSFPCDELTMTDYPRVIAAIDGRFRKVTKIEQFNIVEGDYIEISISSSNLFTQWDFLAKCIDYELDCESCLFDCNDRAKIIESSLSGYSQNVDCETALGLSELPPEVPNMTLINELMYVTYDIKRCSSFEGDNVAWNENNNDIFKFLSGVNIAGKFRPISPNDCNIPSNVYSQVRFGGFPSEMSNSELTSQHSYLSPYFTSDAIQGQPEWCTSTPENLYFNVSKEVGGDIVFEIHWDNLYQMYLTNINNAISKQTQWYNESYNPITDKDYYATFRIRILEPYSTEWGCSGTGLGESNQDLYLNVHITSEITTGDLENGGKFIRITTPQIDNQFILADDDLCAAEYISVASRVSSIEGTIGQSFNIESNHSTALRRIFTSVWYPVLVNSTPAYSENWNDRRTLHETQLKTIPLNANTLEEIPSLSSITCSSFMDYAVECEYLPTQVNTNGTPTFIYCLTPPPDGTKAYTIDWRNYTLVNLHHWLNGIDYGPIHEWGIVDNLQEPPELIASGDTLTNTYEIINPNHFI